MRIVQLRQWKWGSLPTYNGFVHVERVRGWQLLNLLAETGKLDKPRLCSISGAVERLHYHSENYYGWEPQVVYQPIHMALHRRFSRPDEWQKIVERFAVTGREWFATLSPTPVDVAGDLRRLHGDSVADIFSRAPIPADFVIGENDIHRGQPETSSDSG